MATATKKATKKTSGRKGSFKATDGKVLIQTKVPAATFKKLKDRAEKMGYSVAAYVRHRVTEAVR